MVDCLKLTLIEKETRWSKYNALRTIAGIIEELIEEDRRSTVSVTNEHAEEIPLSYGDAYCPRCHNPMAKHLENGIYHHHQCISCGVKERLRRYIEEKEKEPAFEEKNHVDFGSHLVFEFPIEKEKKIIPEDPDLIRRIKAVDIQPLKRKKKNESEADRYSQADSEQVARVLQGQKERGYSLLDKKEEFPSCFGKYDPHADDCIKCFEYRARCFEKRKNKKEEDE